MPDDHSELVPPLPIPNRTVKRLHANDSADTRVKVGNRQAPQKSKTPPHQVGFLRLRSPLCLIARLTSVSAAQSDGSPCIFIPDLRETYPCRCCANVAKAGKLECISARNASGYTQYFRVSDAMFAADVYAELPRGDKTGNA